MNAISARSKIDTDVVPLVVWQLSEIAYSTRKALSIPQRLPDYVLIWIISGAGTLSVDQVDVELTSGKVYWIRPGQLHALEMNAGVKGYLLRFNSEFLSHQDFILSSIYEYGFLYSSSSLTTISIPMNMQPFLRATIDRMLKEIENLYAFQREVLMSLLKLFLLDVSRHVDYKSVIAQHNERNVDLVNRFLLLLEKQYATRKSVHFYANELHVRPNYLNTIVKKVSRFQASYHIRQRVIIEAKRQAAVSLSPMKEIAMNLGFKDTSHFSRFFRKSAGMNFTDYKLKVRSQNVNHFDSTS